jgi:diguanylate cyclase (GGDEF)-like protein
LELILPEERQSFCYAEGVLQSSRAERVANSEYQKISLKSQHAGILWIAGGNQKQLQTIQNILAEEIGLILDNAWLFSHTRKLADTDPLTGVMNRRAFLSKAQELVAGLKEGERLSVAVLDVDHFKKVNDTWGHGAGDEVLCAVARRCANVLRQQDVFGRLGGEEFALVMTQSEGQESACSAAERIRVAVGNTGITTSQGLIPVTVSIGVASGQGLELLGLIEQADSALYMAKRSGRNKVCQAQEPI